MRGEERRGEERGEREADNGDDSKRRGK